VSDTATTNPRTETLRESLARFTEPKMAMMLVLGFTAGLPFLLYFSTLGVWLEREKIDIAVIGFFSWFGLSYALKMFWAPLLDRFVPPGFGKIFDRRRAWIFVAQLCIAASLVGIGLSDPTRNLALTALFSGLLAFSSATQDIVIDAWRIEAAEDQDEQAPLAAAYQYGYKTGMVISGGVALFIAGLSNFNTAYIAMAAVMGVAALVFSVWDRKFGVSTATAAGITLISYALFSAFSAMTALFTEGSLGVGIMQFLSIVFQAVTFAATAAFLVYLYRALSDRSSDQKFTPSDMGKGFVFSAILYVIMVAVAVAVGLSIPALFSALGIAPTRKQIAFWAAVVAALPLVVGGAFIPWIRSFSSDDPRLHHPGYGAFTDFFWRHGWIALLILCFVSFYRLSDIVMGTMAKTAYSAMGYGPAEIGLASGIYGSWIVFIGVALGGLSALRLGLKTSLIIGAVVSVFGNLTFAWLVNQPSDSLRPILLAITADNIAGGYAGTVFIAYMSTLVNRSFSGTQYAIFSSVWILGPKLVAGTSGELIKMLDGYANFFTFSAMLGIPAILLSFFANSMKPDREPPPNQAPPPT